MIRRSPALLLVLGALLPLAAACGGDDDSTSASASGSASASAPASGSASAPSDEEPAFAEDDADTVVHVTAVDFEFRLDAETATGPKVFFEVANEGDVEHEFEVLDPDGEAIDEITPFAPGEEKTLALELDPGRYTIQCLVETDEGETHAELGMKTTITVE